MQAQAKATPAQTPQPNGEIKIKYKCVKTVNLFDTPRQNRRFYPHEEQTEKELAIWLKRPKRDFFYDPPFYPWLPPEPIVPKVNFELGFKQ